MRRETSNCKELDGRYSEYSWFSQKCNKVGEPGLFLARFLAISNPLPRNIKHIAQRAPMASTRLPIVSWCSCHIYFASEPDIAARTKHSQVWQRTDIFQNDETGSLQQISRCAALLSPRRNFQLWRVQERKAQVCAKVA